LDKTPIYAQADIKQKHINVALLAWDSVRFKWFFGGNDMPHWFGYTFGYQLRKAYSIKVKKKASELVNIPTVQILEAYDKALTV
jgi:uncharacterized protein YjaZ